MENENQKIVSLNIETNQSRKVSDIPEERPSVWYYEQMAKYYAEFRSDDLIPLDSLEALYEWTCCLNRFLVTFVQPGISESEEIRRACDYYLTNAGLTKENRENFVHLMNNMASWVGYWSTCGDFISHTKEYYLKQEKSLKQLLDDRKVLERKKQERFEQINRGETAYCISVGDSEIYGVTYPQLRELHRIIGSFMNSEKSSFDRKIKVQEGGNIRISKNINLYADEDFFYVSYSLDTFKSDLSGLSAGQMEKVARFMLKFLEEYGEDGGKKVILNVDDSAQETGDGIFFCIKEDDRKPNFKEVPSVAKYIDQEDGQETVIRYDITVNEMSSQTLSFGEFGELYRKVDDFLKKSPEIK